MTREIINVGSSPNDGQGDPIRTAFIKTNNNFGELYSRVQTVPPVSLTGSVGDTAGMTAYDAEYYYYCFANYDGSTDIWNQVPNAAQANVTVLSATGNVTGNYIIGNGSQLTGIDGISTAIQNGNSNVKVYANSNVATSVNGTANVMVITPTLVTITGDLSVSGNASLTGNIVGDRIVNGTTSVEIQTTNGNSNISVGGTSNVAVFATTGAYINGLLSASGNITGGNLLTGAQVVASGVIQTGTGFSTGGYLSVDGGTDLHNTTVTGTLSATGNIISVANISGGNLLTAGLVSATSNIIGSNILTNGLISAAGNVTGNYFIGNGSQLTGVVATSLGTLASLSVTGNTTTGNLLTGGLISATGNITTGNLLTSGLISATGNISGNVFFGSGAGLTNIAVSGGTSIVNGTSNIVAGASGNITVSVAGTPDVVVFATTGEYVSGVVSATGNIIGGNISGTNISGTLATASQTNITSVGTLSSLSVSGNVQGGNLQTAGLISATGNIIGGNISGTNISGTLATASQTNITSVGTLGNLSVTANITAGNISVSNYTGTTVSVSGNVTGNYFVGTATSAQYADIAENYTADSNYTPGTVLEFGGTKEVTMAANETTRVAGIVSTIPAHLMNSMLTSEYVVAVALLGRVPCKVRGNVAKGDMLISAGDGYACAKQNPIMGSVIGKALESSTSDHSIIEVVVGRL